MASLLRSAISVVFSASRRRLGWATGRYGTFTSAGYVWVRVVSTFVLSGKSTNDLRTVPWKQSDAGQIYRAIAKCTGDALSPGLDRLFLNGVIGRRHHTLAVIHISSGINNNNNKHLMGSYLVGGSSLGTWTLGLFWATVGAAPRNLRQQ